jgi:hypothetical protein
MKTTTIQAKNLEVGKHKILYRDSWMIVRDIQKREDASGHAIIRVYIDHINNPRAYNYRDFAPTDCVIRRINIFG